MAESSIFRKAILDYRVWIAIALTIIGGTFIFGGQIPGLSVALGIGFGMFSLWVIWLLISLMGRAAPANPRAYFGALLSILMFLMKLPLFFWAMAVVYSLGEPAPTCFLAGIVLVYSLSIGWAVARH